MRKICEDLDVPSMASLAQTNSEFRYIGGIALESHKRFVKHVRYMWRIASKILYSMRNTEKPKQHVHFWKAVGVLRADDTEWESTGSCSLRNKNVPELKYEYYTWQYGRATAFTCKVNAVIIVWKLDDYGFSMSIDGIVWSIYGWRDDRTIEKPSVMFESVPPLDEEKARLAAQTSGGTSWIEAMILKDKHDKADEKNEEIQRNMYIIRTVNASIGSM
jgi:hypothetical protein